MNGKGSRNRTKDFKKFRENWDKVFNNDLKRTHKGQKEALKTTK